MTIAKVVQLSDLHLVAPGGKLFGAVPSERLPQAIDAIVRDHADAELCLLTGDLADSNPDEAYRELAAMTTRLPMPICPMMGNHDDRARLRSAFPQPGGDSGFMQYPCDMSAGRFLLLDTADAGKGSGLYCAERQDWLRRQLAACAGPSAAAGTAFRSPARTPRTTRSRSTSPACPRRATCPAARCRPPSAWR